VGDRAQDARVCIVIRTKDRLGLLRRAFEDILAQDLQEWEAIVVNDGGDAVALDALAAEYSAGFDGRLRTIHLARSLGRWPTANAGVAASEAPFIVLHDDDDTWHPQFLRTAVDYLDSHPDEYGVVARTEVIIEEPRGEAFVEVSRYLLEDHNPEILLADLLRFNRFVPISFLYRRTLHDRLGAYDESLPAAGDWAFNLAAVALRPVRYLSDKPLAFWHQRPAITGVLGNSVHAATGDHAIADRRYRDDNLRDYVAHAGLGLPLYISEIVTSQTRELIARIDAVTAAEVPLREQISRLEARLDALTAGSDRVEHHLQRTIDARLRGWVWRLKQRVRRRRHRGPGVSSGRRRRPQRLARPCRRAG
jgi:glycosyltransferase involved in cell wall biosynthesis